MLTHYKRTPTQKVARGFSYLFMALCVCVALFPIIWVVLSSFKTNSEIFSNGLSLPSHFSFDGYVQALEIAPILKFFANSLIIATITTILNVFCLAMAGYVFAKKRFRFKNTIYAILSLSMVIPTTALMSPVYNIITKLGLYDTKFALILVYTALNMPISLMVLRSAFASIPTELEEAAYIDGVSQTLTSADVTTNRYPTINPLATTSYVGAQGRLTEVYAMENGTYRLVEINTYLAVVSGVKAAYTDRNGHVIPATTTFTVYQNKQGTATKTYTYQSDAFTVGQYALVKIVNPNGANTSVSYIAEATATTPVTSGTVVRYTNGSGTVAPTTTVGQANPYNDADKFILMGGTNYNNKQATLGKGYSVFADQYGNIIGLAEMTNNYLVVEAIRWIHDGTLRGGYALADVVLADGSRVQNVTVSTVGGVAVTNTSTSSVQNIGNPKTAFVSDYWTNNSAYYNHLTTYSVNADGTYNLGYNTAGGDICFGNDNTAKSATITTGLTTITGAVAGSAINYVVANDSTVFLVKQADGTYTTYVGKNNVPSMTNATICYLTSGGYATVVLVTEYTVAANTFVAYVSDNAYTGRVTGLGNEYVVWKADGTATYVYSNDSTLLNGKPEGFYTLEVANNGVVASFKEASTFMGAFGVNDVEAGTYAGPTVDGYSWDRAFVDSLAGNSLRATTAGDAQFADYFVDNAKYFVINKTAGNGVNYTTVTETTSASVAENQKIIVAYTMVGGVKHAQYVYICTTIGEDINNPVTPANVTSITAKDDGSVYLTLSADAKVGDTYQFTVEKLGDNGYVYVGTFNATVQGNTKAAWVNLSHILSNGTYQVKCGSLTDIHTYT